MRTTAAPLLAMGGCPLLATAFNGILSLATAAAFDGILSCATTAAKLCLGVVAGQAAAALHVGVLCDWLGASRDAPLGVAVPGACLEPALGVKAVVAWQEATMDPFRGVRTPCNWHGASIEPPLGVKVPRSCMEPPLGVKAPCNWQGAVMDPPPGVETPCSRLGANMDPALGAGVPGSWHGASMDPPLDVTFPAGTCTEDPLLGVKVPGGTCIDAALGVKAPCNFMDLGVVS